MATKKFDRNTGLGGTDISAVVGENQFKSSMDVYLEKRGLVDPTPENFRMKMGKMMEPVIAQEYMDRNKVDIYKPPFEIRDPKMPFFFGSPDGYVLPWKSLKTAKDGAWEAPEMLSINKGLEIKRVGLQMQREFGQAGTDDLPSHIIIQVQWYAGITLIPVWDVAALLGDDNYREFVVEKDDELIGNLRDVGEKFWKDNILAGVPPTPDGTARTREAIAKLYPENRGHFHPATAEDIKWAFILKDTRYQIANLEETKGVAENNLKLSIADGDGILLPDGNEKITWKKTKGRVKVDYKGLADQFDPSEELIQRFTSITDGHKMFLVPRKWKEKK